MRARVRACVRARARVLACVCVRTRLRALCAGPQAVPRLKRARGRTLASGRSHCSSSLAGGTRWQRRLGAQMAGEGGRTHS